MTLNDFLTKLEFYNKKDEIDWSLVGSNLTLIRGIDKKGRQFCPVTWVCYKHEHKLFSEFLMENAGRKLGLSRNDTWNLLFAADFNENDYRAKLGTKAIFDIGLRIRLESVLKPIKEK